METKCVYLYQYKTVTLVRKFVIRVTKFVIYIRNFVIKIISKKRKN